MTVLVTHDPLDALTLADHLVFVEDGRVTQAGTPAEVLSEPRSCYVGTVVGLNLYAGQGDSHGHVRTPDGGLVVTTSPTEGKVWATIHLNTVARSCNKNQRIYSKSVNSSGVSIGSAK